MILDKSKILFACFFGVLTIFLLFNFCLARELEIIYPDLPGLQKPLSTKTFLPDYVKYMFYLSVTIAGLVAFGSLVYGGFRYLTSAGNPTALKDAQDQMLASILGLVVLLCSFLILFTINPQLLIFKLELKYAGSGVILYKNSNCPGSANPEAAGLKPDIDYIRVRQSLRNLPDEFKNFGSIYFYEGPDDLKVITYPEEKWEGTGNLCTNPVPPIRCGSCAGGIKSIELQWLDTGVYLCKDSTKKECIFYKESSASLPKEFNDKIGYVYFKNPADGPKYGTVLHSEINFKGKCQLFPGDGNVKRTGWGAGTQEWVSSVTVFKQNEVRSDGTGVILYRDRDYNKNSCVGEKYEQYKECKAGDCSAACVDVPDACKCRGPLPVAEETAAMGIVSEWDWGDSVFVNGKFMALLYSEQNYGGETIKGECEVFFNSDEFLRDNPIAKCGFWGNHGCFKSFQIISIK